MSNDVEPSRVVAAKVAPDNKLVAVSECLTSASCYRRCPARKQPTDSAGSIPHSVPLDVIDNHSGVPRETIAVENSQARQSQLSVYQLFSGTRVKAAPLSCSGSIVLAFSPNSKFVAIVCHARGSTEVLLKVARDDAPRKGAHDERQVLVLWQWEKDRIVGSMSVPNGHVKHVGVVEFSEQKLCIVTTGWHHCRTWIWTRDGLKTHAFLPAVEKPGIYISVLWNDQQALVPENARLKDAADDTKDRQTLELISSCKNSTLLPRLFLLTHISVQAHAESQKPAKNNMQNEQSDENVMIFDVCSGGNTFDHRQTLGFHLPGSEPVAMSAHSRGFCVAGSGGRIALFECHDHATKYPYTLLRSFCITNSLTCNPQWTRISASTTGDLIALHARDQGIYIYPLSIVDTEHLDCDTKLSAKLQPLVNGQNSTDSATVNMDVGNHRPTVLTLGADGTLHAWNYHDKRCELAQKSFLTSSADTPKCIALHPLGGQLLVGLGESVHLYSVLRLSLKFLCALPISKCQALRYSHGGHQIACAAWITVIIVSSLSLVPICYLGGHTLPVNSIAWTFDDLSLFTAGMDGAVCGWDLVCNSRLEEASMLSCDSQFCAIVVRSSSSNDRSELSTSCKRFSVVGATVDGKLREVSWTAHLADTGRMTEQADSSPCQLKEHGSPSDEFNGDRCGIVTTLSAHTSIELLFAGTSMGHIRVYEWSDGLGIVFTQYCAHDGAVSALCISADASYLFSGASDGIVFMFTLVPLNDRDCDRRMGEMTCLLKTHNDASVSMCGIAVDIVQVSLEEMDMTERQLKGLCKTT